MSTISNKELIEKLTTYFLKQDPEVVCKLLAAAMIDMSRYRNFDKLGDEELRSLLYRTEHNFHELQDFVKEWPNNAPLRYENRTKPE